ncbi:MAG: hypothetical protein QOH39_2871 [Verrucomicrobiota bacterium]|jgi:AcrR family transcriptional regulator
MFIDAPARRERRRQQIREEILHAAREIFVRTGYESFSIRALAQSVGYSPAAIYLHFENKQQIFDLLVEESFAHLNNELQALIEKPNKNPRSQLKAGLEFYVHWGLKYPSEYQVAFVLRNPDKKPYRTHPAFDIARTLVKRCLAGSGNAPREMELKTQALWAATHGITSLLIQRPNFPWVSKKHLIAQVIDSAVNGAINSKNGHRK